MGTWLAKLTDDHGEWLMTARADKTKITREDVTLLRGGQVIGVDDGVIGVVGSMPLDPTTASPRWVTIRRDHSGVVHAPLPLYNSEVCGPRPHA